MKSELKTLYESILGGDRASTPEQVQAELDSGVAADVILNEGMIGYGRGQYRYHGLFRGLAMGA